LFSNKGTPEWYPVVCALKRPRQQRPPRERRGCAVCEGVQACLRRTEVVSGQLQAGLAAKRWLLQLGGLRLSIGRWAQNNHKVEFSDECRSGNGGSSASQNKSRSRQAHSVLVARLLRTRPDQLSSSGSTEGITLRSCWPRDPASHLLNTDGRALALVVCLAPEFRSKYRARTRK